jgi:hypothetical protein
MSKDRDTKTEDVELIKDLKRKLDGSRKTVSANFEWRKGLLSKISATIIFA